MGEKEAENLKSAESNGPTFLIKLWNSSQWTWDNIRRTNNNVATFTTQYKSQLDMHPSVWKLILLLKKKEILVKMKMDSSE